ncbi:reprolysin-like metallopeptidase [Chryseobacterium geocarposphaerae]|uniref:Putative secreted protein (Por secretion system target) n=1 Tax=Chryseobacterium geocarposphaerae TaxID=1416776 RepID=A0A2M9CBF5_9FLAO|nr:zinc-dependent metalloprotease family protein [Chryseobacterium geocarposphaerae]PJJ68169.1 putative secreted protein (Por secretion system target) [Chryseobacterium geocarposphaerae]
MKKLITVLFCSVIAMPAFAQWSPSSRPVRSSKAEISPVTGYYKLNIQQLQQQLKNAQETGPNAKPVEISLPTLNGRMEKFAVYSFPVMAKELADQYQLGSYIGVGIDDPNKQLRFSVAPNDFQSMITNNGQYEFIDAQNSDKTIYGVHPKTINTNGKSFVCSTEENPQMINQIQQMAKKGQMFSNQANDTSKNSDKKYRTMRLAISATSSYVTFTGGTLASALAQINATMTRVNGVFEKDFALHLNIANFPGIIYTDPATDPYVGVTNLNLKLQQLLTANVGDANYDIGHVFNAAGGNGNAGCIGCVCIAPATTNSLAKGSAFTQSTSPTGDTFDIDYVAHEMGHQLGANHTFAHSIEGSGVNMEPGSGSTIMGYAGITNADVQAHSDAYFHVASIIQVQNNLTSKTCDTETAIANNPPVIASLPTYSIPKGTAFVLTASATDPENDPLTYTWEEFDDAGAVVNGVITGGTITAANLGTTTYGASFRSIAPTTSPTRYFPKLSSVLNGVLNNSTNQWESVSQVARASNFAVTVRDNNANVFQQQTQSALQTINVGSDGPFKVNDLYQYGFVNVAAPILWDVVNTSSAPYSVTNVKIDYTVDNGTTWNVLIASTPNDGSENFTFPASLNNQTIKLRISAIGNVFYAVKTIYVTTSAVCGSAPNGIFINTITSTTANVNWAPISGATSYNIRYKKVSDTNWTQTTSTTNSVALSNLTAATAYEVQVATVCSGAPSGYSSSGNFSTLATTYCTASGVSGSPFYISNVSVTGSINNTSGTSTYTDFTTNSALQLNLVKGSQYSITVTGAAANYNTVMVFIDYNLDGTFASTERILNFPVANTAAFTGTFTVPSTAIEGQPLRMRILYAYAGSANVGLVGPATWACGTGNYYGEVEDYNVVVTAALGTNDITNTKDGIQIYPNPATDFLNVTKVSDKATYKIYNTAGQLVSNGNISGGKINVSALVKGAYVISIEDKGNDLFKSKFIKK